jgi:6-phosphofructokinase 1
LRVGILTGGGDAPGLNAVIRAFVKYAIVSYGWDVIGVEDAFNGLLESPRRLRAMTPRSCQGLLHRGGTVLGTTNHGDPFAWSTPAGPIDRSGELANAVAEEELDGLVVIGGDGTMRIAWRLMQERGIPVVGVPKTIDNDLAATDVTFGFQSAVDCATDALDRLHTTAESHDRVMFLEVMGRDAGHIALAAGISGGADVILLPEIPYDPARVAEKVARRVRNGRPFTLVVVAEGALPARPDGSAVPAGEVKQALKDGGGAGQIAMRAVSRYVDAEARLCVLGHLQRGGSPVAVDRLLATRFGVAAVDLVAAGRWGEMVRIHHDVVTGVPLAAATSSMRFVPADSQLIATGRAVGIEFGRAV